MNRLSSSIISLNNVLTLRSVASKVETSVCSAVSRVSSSDIVSRTAGMAAKIGCFGAFLAVTAASPMPLESWSVPALLVPWWGSSTWMEWVCYDFIRSAVATEGGALGRLVPHRHYQEVRSAFQSGSRGFYLCAATLLTLYGYVWCHMPSISLLLLQKMDLQLSCLGGLGSEEELFRLMFSCFES